MSLSRKFIIAFMASVLFIALANILVFYFSYTVYLKEYLQEKVQLRSEVTIEYINEILEKQAIDDIDNIFNNVELELFELLENNNGTIPLTEEQNVNIVVDYLVQSGVAPKYIEEIIPVNNFKKILDSLKDSESPEFKFVRKLFLTVVVSNIVFICIISFLMLIFTQKIILPIKKATMSIRWLKPGNGEEDVIQYTKKDEIGLLIWAINGLNKKLNLQEGIRNRLLADISHELKTPITSIQCYLEGIADGVIEVNQKNLDSITSEMGRLIELVNTIMEYEKFENKKLQLNTSVEDIPEVIEQVVETHITRLKENSQTIKIDGVETLFLDIDVSLFKQLVHNLVGNFLKYAGKNATLTIHVTKTSIEFRDNGEWISKDKVPFLKEKFYQGKEEKTWKINERGIGVWLSIIQKIATAHGWKTQIRSDTAKGFDYKIYI